MGWLSYCLVIASILAVVDPSASAQASVEEQPMATYRVRHDHAVGSGAGELRITHAGIEFVGAEDEAKDSHVWRDSDIRRLVVERDKIEVYAYEARRIPVVPSHVPFVGSSKAIRAGSERKYEFELASGEVSPDVARALLARFDRPVATNLVEAVADDRGDLLFEIGAFHRHLSGGDAGVLRVYERSVVFEARDGEASHVWRFRDIRDVSRLGRFGLELATYEPKRWMDGKSYVFDLERPMKPAEYDALWQRMYGER